MNCNSTLRCLAKALPLAAFFLLLLSVRVSAQCDIAAPPQPINLTLTLNPINGTARFSYITAGIYVSSVGCAPLFPVRYRFYEDEARTLPKQTGITLVDGPYLDYNCSHVGQTDIVWVAVNPGGAGTTTPLPPAIKVNESEAVEFRITIVDGTVPTLAVNPIVNANTSLDGVGDCSVIGSALPAINMVQVVKTAMPLMPGQYTDNCLPVSLTYLVSGATSASGTGVPIGVAFNAGVSVITYTVTDGAGNTNTAQITVTITDDESPSITCPGPVTTSTDPGVCTRILDNSVLTPVTADNCVASPALTYALAGATVGAGSGIAQVPYDKGVTTVTYTVDDGINPTANCMFNITITDDEDPVIGALPADQSLFTTTMSCDQDFSWNHPTVTDNCPGPYMLTFEASGATTFGPVAVTPGDPITFTFDKGVSTVTYVATDAAANTSSASFTVTVSDNVAPEVTQLPLILSPPYQSAYVVDADPGSCNKTVQWYRPSQLTHDVMDNCGGLVALVEGPAIINGVPDAGFLSGIAPTPYDPLDFYDPSYFLFWLTPLSASFPIGTTIIPYYLYDDEGNEAVIQITVTVNETQPPNAVCTAPGTVTITLDNAGAASVTPMMINNGSTDNCGIAQIIATPLSFDCNAIGAPQTVTLTVEDFAGNTATCTTTINVIDNTPPVLQCPNSVTVSSDPLTCTKSVPGLGMTLETVLANLGPGEYYDNSFACGFPTPHREYAINGGPFQTPISGLSTFQFPTGVNNVIIRIKDASNNFTTCSFTATVQDLVAPTYNGVGQAAGTTITANANLGGCLALVNWTPPQFDESCSPPVTVLSSHIPGSFFLFGNTVVTYTATDAAGNVRTHSFNINVVDTQNPVAKCKDITVSLDAFGTVTVPASAIDAGSTDNCFFTYTIPSYTFNCGNLGLNTRTMTIVDGQGNSASCEAVITVEDNIPPVASCAVIPFIDLDANGMATLNATTLNGGSTDNCPSSLSFTLSVDGSPYAPSYAFVCDDLGIRTVILRVTDGGGNTAECFQNIEIRDVTTPMFTAPGPITINCEADKLPLATGKPSDLSDRCDPNPTLTYSDAVAAGLCLQEFVITRTWLASDASGNTVSANQTITVVDDTAPVFSMSVNITLNTDDPLFCDGDGVFIAQVTADSVADNCADFSSLTISHSIVFPTPDYGYSYPSGFQPGAVVPFSFFPIGTTVVTWRAEDPCGNARTFVQNITVLDTQAPVFTYAQCGVNDTLFNTTGSCNNLYTWIRPVLGVDIFECGPAIPSTIEETVSNPSVQNFLNVTNPYNQNGTPPVIAQFPIGTTTVTYTATDAAMNVSTCSFTVTIVDNEPPMVTCPANQTLATTCETGAVPNYAALVQVMDNCPNNLSLTQTPPQGTLLSAIFGGQPTNGDQFAVSVIIEDSNPANTQVCNFTVTLADGDAPVPVETFLAPILGFCGADTIYAPLALDPCNPSDTIWGTPSTPLGTLLNTTLPSYFLNAGNYIITWVYNDGNGNISTQQQFITLLADNFPPVALCKPGFTLNLDGAGNASVNLLQIDNGSNDPYACGPTSTTISPTSFNCSNIGVNNVTLVITDNAGNTASCATPVTVKDVTPPILPPAPANITVEACSPIPPAAVLNAADACDSNVPIVFTEISTQDTAGFGFYNYSITRTWSATDDSGNTSIRTQFILVEDSEAPVFSPMAPDTIVVFTEGNDLNCDAVVQFDIIPFVSDCATGADLTIVNSFNSQGALINANLPKGTYVVVFTATDISGNIGKDTVVIIVNDGTPPIAACINGVAIALQPLGTVIVTPAQINANSSDNCTPMGQLQLSVQRLDPSGPVSTSIPFSCIDADGVTQHPVRLYVKDQADLESTCETYVIVQDTEDPSFTDCPASKTLDCSADLSPDIQGEALATDNCPANVIVTFVDSVFMAQAPACTLIKRTWIATDLSGNQAFCIQNFNILDTIKPVFAQLPANDTIECGQPLPPLPTLSATDNCTDDLDINIALVIDTIDLASGLCGLYNYTVRRTWTATDACGNSVEAVQLIVVRDTEAPQFVNFPDTIEAFTASIPMNMACSVQVNFNVGQFLQDCAALDDLLVSNDAPFGDTSLSISGLYPVGIYKIAFAANDACNNINTDTLTLLVIDNSIPTMVCEMGISIALGSNGMAMINAADLNIGSTDNCGIDTFTLSKSVFDCTDLGQNVVTLTAVDAAGNSNFCTVAVTVTLGNTVGFSLSVSGTNETVSGASNGTATAMPTGGSGNFAFEWSTLDSTAMITNLPPGIYFVTVTDLGTGCVQTGSVTVETGNKIELIVGAAAGAQGQTVQVPVTVNNFIDVLAFSFTLNVVDPSVGTVAGVSNVNPALAGLIANIQPGNNMTIGWTSINPLSLPNGSILFTLDVTLGTAPIGSVSAVNVTNTPLDIEFNVDLNGQPVIAMLDTVNGQVTIDDNIPNVTVAGDIMTWRVPTLPVPGVEVSLGGSVNDMQTTGAPGTYSFAVPSGSDTDVSCFKSTPGNAGITSADLLLIQNHIFGQQLASPYQWVAADANGDGSISLNDYLRIQRVVLGTDQHIPGSPDWRFIPKSYVFPTPPLSLPIPENIFRTNVTMDFLDDDFVAVRMGDVNGNIIPSFTTDDVDDRTGALRFDIPDRNYRAGEMVEVAFKANDFTDRQAYQMTIAFDAQKLRFEGFEKAALTEIAENNLGLTRVNEGLLTTLWVGREITTLQDGEILFVLRFRALDDLSGLSKMMYPGSQITRAEAYTLGGDVQGIEFNFVRENAADPSEGSLALFQNYPNPFQSFTLISFTLPQAGDATLRIFDQHGRLARMFDQQFGQGLHTVRIEKSELGAPGVYWYELEMNGQRERRKMVLID